MDRLSLRPNRSPTSRAASALLQICAAAAAVAAGLASEARAQSIERNLPPAPQAPPAGLPTPKPPETQNDATPLGANLRAIVVLGPTDAPLGGPVIDGFDAHRVARLDTPRDLARLRRFFGRPVSRKLISQVEAAIVLAYRAKGYPFVSVTTPEQEIGGGVLQVRVIEFHLEAKSAPGASPELSAYLLHRLRVKPGEAINAGQLAQDLDWLNRYPFRRNQAAFTPGDALGDTDLILQATPSRPWSVYAGYANSGSPLTGEDRYFVGAQAAIPWLRDAFASYQFTASGDAFAQANHLGSAEHPRYETSAVNLDIPTLPRQEFDIGFDYVATNQLNQVFLTQQNTYEVTLRYRSALSNLIGVLPGDIAIGTELKRQYSRLLFDNLLISDDHVDIIQFTGAYSARETDGAGNTVGDATLHISPGGLDGLNSDAAIAAFSKGRTTSMRYAYLGADLTRTTNLPRLIGPGGWTLTNSLIGQYAATPLPLTEQMGLGGQSLVRGYTLDDGAFDAAVIMRNELRAPTFSLPAPPRLRIDNVLSPFVFVDAGVGRDRYFKTNAEPASFGVGSDMTLLGRFSVSLDGAYAMTAVGRTPSGSLRLESRVTASF